MKYTAFYVRVSTLGQNLENQLPDLKRWAAVHELPAPPDDDWLPAGYWESELARWYADKFTGKTLKRPGFERIESQLGKIDRIVVWRTDRLGRTAGGLCPLFETLVKKSIDLISITEGFSLTTSFGRLQANMIAAIAAWETEVRAERQASGIENAREKSRKAHRLQAEGVDRAMIAQRLGISMKTVDKILSRPAGWCWWGPWDGEDDRLARSAQEVADLVRSGFSLSQICKHLGISKATYCRRLRAGSKLFLG